MVKTLYYIGLKLYSLAIWLASFFHKKARLLFAGRRNSWPKLQEFKQTNTKPVIWFHCASLGEFEQGRPLIEACKKELTEHAIVLTFFSPSGYEIRKNYPHADLIAYLPADSPTNAKRFYDLVKPELAVFVKYEFWHYYISTMVKNAVHTISVSAIFIPEHHIFKSGRTFFRKMVASFDTLFVQNEQSKALLQSIDINQVEISGDTRFDRVLEIESQKKEITIAEQFVNSTFCFVIGSAWVQDLQVIGTTLNSFDAPLKVIIAPHEIDEENILKIEAFFKNKRVARYSTFSNKSESDVLIVDNIGMLSSLYQYADIAYVGGAFGKGLHNTLEAAVYGIPVIFGSNYHKFQEAIDLVKLQGAFTVNNTEEFNQVFGDLYNDSEFRLDCGSKAGKFVKERAGATKQIMEYIKRYFQAHG